MVYFQNNCEGEFFPRSPRSTPSSYSAGASTDSETFVGVDGSLGLKILFEQAETEDLLKVEPSDLKKLVTSDKKVTVSRFLVLIHGLPHSGKSDVIQKFLQKIPNAHFERSEHFYQLAAVENAESGRLHMPTLAYSMTTSKDCYVYTMKSAMRQVATGRRIKYMGGRNIKNLVEFSNEDLNAHFQDLFLDLE